MNNTMDILTKKRIVTIGNSNGVVLPKELIRHKSHVNIVLLDDLELNMFDELFSKVK